MRAADYAPDALFGDLTPSGAVRSTTQKRPRPLCEPGRVDDHHEEVVEANTLLSGLGFESGGLAVAHGAAQSCSAVAVIHANHLHGEMVAFGLMCQLAMKEDPAEAQRVAAFLCEVGLPVTLTQLSLDEHDADALRLIAAGTEAGAEKSSLAHAAAASGGREIVVLKGACDPPSPTRAGRPRRAARHFGLSVSFTSEGWRTSPTTAWPYRCRQRRMRWRVRCRRRR